MKKTMAFAISVLLFTTISTAQSKVFKEVNDEISTSMQPIIQDGALVGYLVFTQLEKLSEDSFSYKITIMDENLNDLGTVNFREEKMSLEAVSFEQDILCLAYFKADMIGKEFKNRKAFNAVSSNNKSSVVLQFLDLSGKVIKKNKLPLNIKLDAYNNAGSKVIATGKLKHGIQLRNIPQKGFACFYADDSNNPLALFNTQGERLWKKKLPDEKGYVLLTTQDEIYVLIKNNTDNYDEGGYLINSYGVTDSADHISNYRLVDKEGNALKVLSFENDPVSGKPYLAGTVINSKYKNIFYTGKGLSKGAYSGVFTIDLEGKSESDIKTTYSYWKDGSKDPSISTKGKYADNNAYMNYNRCIRDFQGNTFFVGSSLLKRVRWGSIAVSTLLLPLIIVSPMWLGTTGTHKYKIRDAMVLKLDKKGNLNFDNFIDCNSTGFHHSREALVSYDDKKFFHVANSANKSDYVVVDDTKDIVIYNLTQKKVVRNISHKDGKSRINIYPAKEGHIMVSEYNKKEKYTRLSIEAL